MKVIKILSISIIFNTSILTAQYSPLNTKISQYDSVAHCALIHYPELEKLPIKFTEKSLRTTAACRPVWYTLFRARKNRKYTIYINSDSARIKGAQLCKVPTNGQVGVLGHELGHVVDYSKKSSVGVIFLGIKYLFIPQRRIIEHRTDSITIYHNLGNELIEFSSFILSSPTIPESYKAYKRKVYYTPDQLREIMRRDTLLSNRY